MIDEQTAQEWLTGLSAFDRDNETILYCILAAFGRPSSLLDVGSGTGAMVNMAEKIGVEKVAGLDQLPRPAHPKLLQVDLREPILLSNRPFELVTSIETAEHIEPEYADNLVTTITENAGRRIVFTAAMPGQMGHGHVNCVLEDTEIVSPPVMSAMRREYRGEVLTIVTASGKVLTVTPNHPILTTSGWVAANLLVEGANVLCYDRRNRESLGVMPNNENRPSMVKEVFDSLSVEFNSARRSVPLTSEDFHRDSPNGDVEIIDVNRFLVDGFNASLFEPRTDLKFEVGDVGLFPFSRLSAEYPYPYTIFLPQSLGVGISSERFAVSGSGLRHSVSESVRSTTDRLPVFLEEGGNHPLSDIVNLTDFYGGLSALVERDNVVSIFRKNFVGHVYNLHTSENWYSANGIITHNCQPMEYWRTKFYDRGWNYYPPDTYRLALLLSNAHHASHHVEANLSVFVPR